LVDSFGKAVTLPRGALPADLHPPDDKLRMQLPSPPRGASLPAAVQRRQMEGRSPRLVFAPSTHPSLAPYLAGEDELGNTLLQPGALVNFVPLESVLQKTKFSLSEVGVRYQLAQALTWSGLTDPASGAGSLGYYNVKLLAKWTVFDAPAPGAAGWLSLEADAKTGLGGAGRHESAQTNLGTLTKPSGLSPQAGGVRVPELAWQQALHHGEVVVLAGVIDQSNYLDANLYANSGRGQFLNSALINSMVLPLPAFNFALNLQWQPASAWYAMLGATAGNAQAGEVPWTDFEWTDWSVTTELGWTPHDVLGLGPGVYRIQPFAARLGGPVQGGLALNCQQQLGRESPLAWFGRFGVGSEAVSAGASAQVGTGVVLHAPFYSARGDQRWSNDLAGAALVWSRPSATTQTIYHENEYVLETFYTLQLTPTTRVQPDVQIVWDPAFNPDPGPSTVFQLQVLLGW
jgi:porin